MDNLISGREKRRKAFTLIELLVVISIIALLLSILLPSLQKVKDLARKTVCQSQFHSVGLSLTLYANDYNKYPKPMVSDTLPEQESYETGVLPYIVRDKFYQIAKTSYGMAPKVLVCPTYVGYGYDGKKTANELLESRASGEHDTENDLSYWAPSPPHWPGRRQMGIFILARIDHKTCAIRPEDRASKLLGADINMYWDEPYHWSCHQTRDASGLPAGTNRLHNDGSVVWVSNKVMAQDEQPLTAGDNGRWEGPYKYNHSPGLVRNYYW